MQNQQKQQKKTKQKRELVFKPYLKGNWHDGAAVRRGLSLLLYYIMFAFLYIVAGSAFTFGGTLVRVVLNLLMVLVCAAILYMNAARQGEGEVAYGEIALGRQQAGKEVSKKDLERCYHPMKGFFIALIAAIPILLLTLPHAVTAVKQVYSLQTLPKWVAAYGAQEEISAPLSYYNRSVPFVGMDVLHLIGRVLVFPFANIATTDNADAMLLVDRLSPVLSLLPLIGYPVGYMTGPRSRAMVHGDISSSNSRVQRRRNKAIKRRQARQPKKNEII